MLRRRYDVPSYEQQVRAHRRRYVVLHHEAEEFIRPLVYRHSARQPHPGSHQNSGPTPVRHVGLPASWQVPRAKDIQEHLWKNKSAYYHPERCCFPIDEAAIRSSSQHAETRGKRRTNNDRPTTAENTSHRLPLLLPSRNHGIGQGLPSGFQTDAETNMPSL
jgi:hypothetical protein